MDLERHNALTRNLQGSMSDLRKSGVLNQVLTIQETLRPVQDMIDAFQARFLLPDQSVVKELIEQLQQGRNLGHPRSVGDLLRIDEGVSGLVDNASGARIGIWPIHAVNWSATKIPDSSIV